MIEHAFPSRNYPPVGVPPRLRTPAYQSIPCGRLREIRLTYRPTTLPAKKGAIVEGAADLWRIFRPLACEPVEVVRVVFLDSGCRLLAFEDLSRGTVDRALIHPRDVFHSAVLLRASAVALLHVHPDGDLGASREDIEITQRLRQAGEVLGIRLVDHVIVGLNDYYSFHDHGWPSAHAPSPGGSATGDSPTSPQRVKPQPT